MATIEETGITYQEQENTTTDNSSTDLTSFQFVPEKIVDFAISQDGQRSYRVRWKDSWLTEELLTLTYQHLINEFWSSTNENAKVEIKQKNKIVKQKPSISKASNKEDDFDTQFTITSGPTVPSTDTSAEQTAINIKELSNIGASSHLIDHGSLIKTQELLTKSATDQTASVDPNTLSSIIVENDVSLADISNISYQEIASAQIPAIPKYQQALQVSLTVQQTLTQDVTGKTVFPKHVFSQTRYGGKKSQPQKQLGDGTEVQRVVCDICQKSLKTKKMLWAHKVAVHYGGNFPCEICGKKCITGAELRRHMTSHSTERKFACQYCGLAYKRWSHLYQHLRVHEEEKNFRCDVCHCNFKVQSELKDHCFAEHADGDVVECSVCKHKLQTPLAVYHHSMKHTGTRDFICQICGSNFKRKQHLVTHMKTHFTEKRGANGTNEIYNCQACDEHFNLKMELKAHCDKAHLCKKSDKPIRCRTCDKKLNLTHSVYLHGLRHCGVREFECDICHQFFKRKAHLLRHQTDRHPAEPRERKKRTTRPEAIMCCLCKRSFKYKAALIKHMSMQHGIFPKADGEIAFRKGIKKPHQCEHCHKRFRSKKNLAKHIQNKHLNEDGSIKEISKEIVDICEDSSQEDNLEDMDAINQGTSTLTSADIVNQNDKEEGSNSSNLEKDVKDNSSDKISEADVEKILSDSLAVMDETPDESSVAVNQQVSSQVVSVDQQTGRIVVIPSDTMMENNQLGQSEVGRTGDSAVNSSDQRDQSPMITELSEGQMEEVRNTSTVYDSQTLVQSIPAVTSANEINQPTAGYIVNQDGVAVASVPLQTVQELSNSGVLEFSQGTSDQIVVLLSALNSQNIEQL